VPSGKWWITRSRIFMMIKANACFISGRSLAENNKAKYAICD